MPRGRGGVRYTDVVEGVGPEAERGATVDVRYSLSLNHGEVLISEQLCTFTIGGRRVVPGLEYGVEGMRPGGRRRVRVGPHLAYGRAGVPPTIPPNAVLELTIELLALQNGASQL